MKNPRRGVIAQDPCKHRSMKSPAPSTSALTNSESASVVQVHTEGGMQFAVRCSQVCEATTGWLLSRVIQYLSEAGGTDTNYSAFALSTNDEFWLPPIDDFL